MGPSISDSDELRAEINVTPLVDVVLVLLVILLLVAPLLKEDVPVELPIAAHAEEDRNAPTTPTLTVADDGSVTFEGAPLPSEDLGNRLGAIYESRPDKAIILAAARSLAYARVVEVMDACRAAGIERIGISTTPPPNVP